MVKEWTATWQKDHGEVILLRTGAQVRCGMERVEEGSEERRERRSKD
jgi:hypothetical protein